MRIAAGLNFFTDLIFQLLRVYFDDCCAYTCGYVGGLIVLLRWVVMGVGTGNRTGGIPSVPDLRS